MDAFLNFQQFIQKLLNHINIDVSLDLNLIFSNSVSEIDEIFLLLYLQCPKVERHEELAGTTKFRIIHMHGTLRFVQQQLITTGTVDLINSPFKNSEETVNKLFKLLVHHRKLYPKCNIGQEEWNNLVDDALAQFNLIPDVIQNPLHQPVNSRLTPARTPTRLKLTRRKLLFVSITEYLTKKIE